MLEMVKEHAGGQDMAAKKLNRTRLIEILEQVSAEELEGAEITMKDGKLVFADPIHETVARVIQRVKDLAKEAKE